MSERLRQSDFEDLSAYLDGELAAERAALIERLVAEEPAWRRAAEEVQALHRALETWPAPKTPEGLCERIVRGVRLAGRPRPRIIRLARWLVPAAAAAILLVVTLTRQGRPAPKADPGGSIVDSALRSVPAKDRFVVEHLEFFQNYELYSVVAKNETLLDDRTLEALDSLEKQGI